MRKEEMEKIIRRVDGTMAIEDMPLTSGDKKNLRDCLSGNTTFEKKIQEIKEKYGR